MSAPGIENYRFGQKNNWRRRVWNEISKRVKDKKNARILYLAGEQNIDAEIAAQKGYDPRNMIAVEIDKRRTKELRKKGVNTICGNLMDVLHSWPDNHKVDIIIADFCFGFESSAIDVYDSICCPPLVDAVVLVNFQRGRDHSTNRIRSLFGKQRFQTVNHKGGKKEEFTHKHRAGQFLLFHAFETVNTMFFGEKDKDGIIYGDSALIDDPYFMNLVSSQLSKMNARLYSYKSGRVFMDSAVFSHVIAATPDHCREILDKANGWVKKFKPIDQSIRRKIIAAIAVQSRKAS
jgi:hypothetical protein